MRIQSVCLMHKSRLVSQSCFTDKTETTTRLIRLSRSAGFKSRCLGYVYTLSRIVAVHKLIQSRQF